ncbi:MAG: hypothetical protein ONB11_01140 [candidate division KSB1 bacterium]|nr:hypothetical protein [candidate division KSB1 bacterium]
MPRVIGYQDLNRDGINDLFCDANGDGINDVTKEPYAHQFEWRDQNQDGLNDQWIDQDGDGVNDLLVELLQKKSRNAKRPWIDRDGDGISDADAPLPMDLDRKEVVLDVDGDGKNDITGLDIRSDNLMGYRYGCVDEEHSTAVNRFEDKDGDGMHDKFGNRWRHESAGKFDYFIDRDGDGISDGRGFEKFGNPNKGHRHGRKNP